jgi:acyl-CoA thioesterase
MFALDHASQALGMRVLATEPGRATVAMVVRQDMLNGFAICHGGLITALADSAFAFACNSAGELTVAAGLVVDFVAPARLGDELIADCHEVAATGRTGVYDAEVRNQAGTLIAVFRGRAQRIKGRPSIPAVEG